MEIYIPDYLKELVEERERLLLAHRKCKNEEEKKKIEVEWYRVVMEMERLKQEKESTKNPQTE